MKAKLLNRQTARRAWQVGEQHYDIGNAFYEAMLDRRMTYIPVATGPQEHRRWMRRRKPNST